VQGTHGISGFTLIELSIVLVIIGLIIGGILVGQDLVRSSYVRAQITQIEKYNTAVNDFRDKYGGIPGDLALTLANQFGFTSTSCLGDGSAPLGGRNGNGLIEGAGLAAPLAALMGENLLFWTDLSAVHLIDGSFPGGGATYVGCPGGSLNLTTTPGSAYLGDYIPPAKIGGGIFVHVYSTTGANWYLLSQIPSFQGVNSQVKGNPVIPVFLSYQMDSKVDDGLPTAGNVQAVNVWTSQQVPVAAPNTTTSGGNATSCYDTTSSTYSININGGTGTNCALSFRLQ